MRELGSSIRKKVRIVYGSYETEAYKRGRKQRRETDLLTQAYRSVPTEDECTTRTEFTVKGLVGREFWWVSVRGSVEG